jgi:very-short-patch-repair endonuclease
MKGTLPWSSGKTIADVNLSRCSKCGELVSKSRIHTCPSHVWNKGISFLSGEKHPFWGKRLTETHRLHISETRIKRLRSGKIKSVPGLKGKHQSEATKKKLSEINKGKHSYLLKLTKPTRPEIMLRNFLEVWFPNQFKYVGDGSFIINGFNPDFIRVNGERLAIEMFGDYWHTKKANTPFDTEEGRKKLFSDFGWRLIIVWEHEIYTNPKKVKAKIISVMIEPLMAMCEELSKRGITT